MKRDSAQDLRIQYAILPVRSLLDIKAAGYFWKWKNKLLPAFKYVHIITANIKKQERTNQLVYNTFTKSQILSGCFFKRVVSLWNTLPAKIREKDQKFDTLKGKLKRYFLEKFLSDHDSLNTASSVGENANLYRIVLINCLRTHPLPLQYKISRVF